MDTDDPGQQQTPLLSRRMMLTSATALTPVAASLWGLRAEADPGKVGRWSAPFPLGGMAIHATLLHTDDVLIFQYVEHRPTIDHTSWIATWNWRTRMTTRVRLPYDRDLFCAGHSVLPDGRLFVAGGHDHTTGYRQDVVGTNRCDIYDPDTRRWTRATRCPRSGGTRPTSDSEMGACSSSAGWTGTSGGPRSSMSTTRGRTACDASDSRTGIPWASIPACT